MGRGGPIGPGSAMADCRLPEPRADIEGGGGLGSVFWGGGPIGSGVTTGRVPIGRGESNPGAPKFRGNAEGPPGPCWGIEGPRANPLSYRTGLDGT